MASARVIICERSRRWATALRREPLLADVRVRELRSPTQLWRELSEHPASFLALELTDRTGEQIIEVLTELARRHPDARAAVLTSPAMRDYQWLMREAGAVHVQFSVQRLGRLARMIERHLASLPADEMDTREEIMARLPWEN